MGCAEGFYMKNLIAYIAIACASVFCAATTRPQVSDSAASTAAAPALISAAPAALTTATSGSSALTPEVSKQKYEYIATQIDREDQLINFRLTWTLTANGFLFAALAFVHSKDGSHKTGREFFQVALPILGFVFSVSGLLGVISAQIQELDLIQEWKNLQNSPWPRPYGRFPFGGVPSLVVPIALTFLWVAYGIWYRRNGREKLL